MRRFLFAALFSLLAPAAAHAAEAGSPNACFASNTWTSWSAPNGGDVLYLKVGMHGVYRVQLTPGTHVYRYGDRFIVNRSTTGWICSPLDLDLTLNDHSGIEEPLIASELRRLTPDEIAALAPDARPY